MAGSSFIRQDTDYAIRALVHLALSENGKSTGAKVAATCGIPRSFAYKILKRMTVAGLVSSRTGRKGGFHLNRDPNQITLHDVVVTVQGPISVRDCVLSDDACPLSTDCPVSAEWQQIHECIEEFLAGTTLQDLVEKFEAAGGPDDES